MTTRLFRPRAVLVLGLVLSLSLVLSLAVGQDPAQADGKTAKTVSSNTETSKKTDGKSWAKQLDDKFGEWVVKPLGKVLFYDFGSGDKKEKGKVVHKGWLGEQGVPFIVVWLLAGAVFFTLRMVFINLRGFRHAIRLTKGDYDDPDDPGEVSHFQALSSALSATVGLGNIAGVAIAVGTGGPGAVFWIVVVGLLGMSSKFAECTLGQIYRKVSPDGTVSGGPMHYLKDGLAEIGAAGLGKVLAIVFAVFCILASLGGGNSFQVVQSLGALQANFHDHGSTWLDTDRFAWVYGLVMAVMVGVVIIGGIRRIGAAAGKIVPLMCTVYVLTSLYILLANATLIPDAFASIFSGAFTPEGVTGGFIGVLVIGVQRAVFSNEAGIGSAAIAHSAAKTDEPVSEGIVALLEPFIDTVVVCTMTGLVIVITGAYDKSNAVYGPILTNPDGIKGAALTMQAMKSQVSWFPWILCAAVVLFAYSTLISWSYYGERCSVLLFGPRASLIYKIVFIICAFLGSLLSASNILKFSDLMILSMAFPNILGVALLSGKVKRALDDYWGRYKAGELERQPTQARSPSE